MNARRLPEQRALILVPEAGDDPADLEDAIHDQLLLEAGPRIEVVVLDLEGLADAPRWMKAAGPEVPDVNLRVALGPQRFAVARALGLDAEFAWYPDVASALRPDA